MIINEEKRLQTMSYIIHAGEILAKESHFPKKIYKNAFIPSGSELYTGALKSVGYLFLDKKIKHIVFLIEQDKYPDDIVSYKDDDSFLIRGSTIKNKNILNTEIQKPVPRELFEQLLYSRLLTKIKLATMIGIGKNYNTKELIKQIPADSGVVFLGKMSIENTIKNSKKEDSEMIESILSQKIYQKDSKRIGNIYTKIVKKHKRKSELIVYVHSSELGIKTQQPIGYSCIIS